MMRFLFILFVPFMLLSSCSNLEKKRQVVSAIEQWIGKELLYPNSTIFTIQGVDTLDNAFLEEYYGTTEYVLAGSEEMKEQVNKCITEETGKEMEKEIVDAAFMNLRFTTEVPKESLNDYAAILFDQQYISSMPDEKLVYEGY